MNTVPTRVPPTAPLRRRRHPSAVHRRDIQGLRMLAVTLVVAFHLAPSALSGGYVGVDVFFVISGYLITGHLVREIVETGRIRLGAFWARRIRRLLPAALLVLAVCIVLTIAVMPSISRTQNLTEIGYAAGYVLNWHLATSAVDYLAASNPDSVVQHYWSLSVEEQFYAIWPVLLLAAIAAASLGARRRTSRERAAVHRRAVLALLCVLFLVSLAFSIFETARSPSSAYFVTTTRVWEFAAGGLVAMAPPLRLITPLRHLLSATALAVILGVAFFYSAATPFPGAAALLPVGATAALLSVGDSDDRFAPQRWSHHRAIQFLGDNSYSIYLWHWPLIVVLSATADRMPEPVRIALIVVMTVLLAWLTKRYVEDPVRRARGALRRRGVTFGAMIAAIAVIMLVVTALTSAIRADIEAQRIALQQQLTTSSAPAPSSTATGAPTSTPAPAPKNCIGAMAILNDCPAPHAYTTAVDPAFAEGDEPWFWYGAEPAISHCTATTVGSWPERSCTFPGNGTRAILIGDSHAEHIFAPLQKAAADRGWALRLASRAACPVFVTATADAGENDARCAVWGAELLSSLIAAPEIDVVIVTVRVDRYQQPKEAEAAFAALRDAGKRVIVLRDVPVVGAYDSEGDRWTAPACVLASSGQDDPCTWADTTEDDWLEKAAATIDAPVVDTHAIICPDGTCHPLIGGVIVYYDDNHLTGTFSLSLAEWLAEQFEPLLGTTASR